MVTVVNEQMLQRRGTSAEWAAANPILGDGEIGYDRDLGIIKLGDGVTPWNGLSTPDILKSVIDAAGDLIVGTGPDSYGRLVRGAEGQHLTVASDGTLVWEDPPTPPASISPAIVDAKGDLIVGVSPDTVARLPAGAAGYILTVAADGSLAWALDTRKVYAAVFSSIAQSIPNATYTTVTYDSEIADAYAMHSPTAAAGRITVPYTGYYEIHSRISWDNIGGGRRLMKISVNGTRDVDGAQAEVVPATGSFVSMQTTAIVHLTANDYLITQAYQSTGSPLLTLAGFVYSHAKYLGT